MGCTGRSQQLFSVYSAIFSMVRKEQQNKQPGDPSASLLLTSVRRQSFAICAQTKGNVCKMRERLCGSPVLMSGVVD